jgi:hypothetical protein
MKSSLTFLNYNTSYVSLAFTSEENLLKWSYAYNWLVMSQLTIISNWLLVHAMWRLSMGGDIQIFNNRGMNNTNNGNLFAWFNTTLHKRMVKLTTRNIFQKWQHWLVYVQFPQRDLHTEWQYLQEKISLNKEGINYMLRRLSH